MSSVVTPIKNSGKVSPLLRVMLETIEKPVCPMDMDTFVRGNTDTGKLVSACVATQVIALVYGWDIDALASSYINRERGESKSGVAIEGRDIYFSLGVMQNEGLLSVQEREENLQDLQYALNSARLGWVSHLFHYTGTPRSEATYDIKLGAIHDDTDKDDFVIQSMKKFINLLEELGC